MQRMQRYLRRQWDRTATRVALLMDYLPLHVVMTHLKQYPDGVYENAGTLVEALLDIEETKPPT